MDRNLTGVENSALTTTVEPNLDALSLLREQNAKRSNEKENRSILGTGLSHLDPKANEVDARLKQLEDESKNNPNVNPTEVLRAIKHDEKVANVQNSIVAHTSDFLKTVPMFVPGKSAFALAAGIYALDEVKPHAKPNQIAEDIALGATKGILNKAAFNYFGNRDWCISAKGTAIGATLGLVNQSLTRDIYLDNEGHVTRASVGQGLAQIAKNAFDPVSLAGQAIACGLSGAAVESANYATRGFLSRSPLATDMCAGFVFGTAGSAESEIRKERKDNQFDLKKVVTESVIGGAVNSLAAIPGHAQSHFSSGVTLRSQTADSRGQEMQERNTPAARRIEHNNDSPTGSVPDQHAHNDNHDAENRHAENTDNQADNTHLADNTTPAHTPLDHQRIALSEWANTRLQNPAQRERFHDLMNKFEERCTKNGVSSDEVSQTYLHLTQLLSAENKAINGVDASTKLAEQILYICANPDVVCQGENKTCTLASIEKRMYTLKPSEATRLITEISINGQYKLNHKSGETSGPDSNPVIINAREIPGLLDEDFESKCLFAEFDPVRDRDLQRNGQRSRASQIFQIAAANVAYAEENLKSPAEQKIYRRKSGYSDKDELVVVDRTRPDEREKLVENSPALGDDQISKLYNRIAGTEDKDFVLLGAQKPEVVEGGAASAPTHQGTPETFRAINNPEELLNHLRTLDAQDRLPAIVTVEGGHPFIRYQRSDGLHAITVNEVGTDQGNKTSVTVSNHWYKPKSSTIAAETLFNAMQPRSQWKNCKPWDYVESSSDSENEADT